MIKKLICFLMLPTLLLISSCAEEQPSTHPQSPSSSRMDSSSVSLQQESTVTSQSEKTEQSAVISDNVLYTFVDTDFLLPWEGYGDVYYQPVSYTVDGQQLRRVDEEKGWGMNGYYPEVDYDAWERKDAVNLYAKDYYHPDSTNYEKLGNAIIAKTNGDWDIFTADVKYISYRGDTEEMPQQKWIDYFDKKRQELYGTKVPILISDAWLFKYNDMDCAIVEADNVAWGEKEETDTSLPAGNKNTVYRMTAVFIGDKYVKLDSYYDFTVSKDPLNHKQYPNNVNCSFVKPSDNYDSEDFGGFEYNTYQYNREGNIETYSIYTNYVYNDNSVNILRYSPYFFIGDVDGDGTAEIVRENNYVSSIGYSIRVINITENGLE